MSDAPDAWRIEILRGEINQLAGALHQLRNVGLDNATTQLLLSRKCAELEGLMKCQSTTGQNLKAAPTTSR
jgi:hypothetical protein